MIPVAILCGGYGTRANLPINKCFIQVGNKPFILHQMEYMESFGYDTFVLCRGTGGTLTALRNARDQLGDRFIVLYGDTLLRLDVTDFISKWDNVATPAIVAMYDKIDAGVNGISGWMLDMLDDDVTDFATLRDEARTRLMTHHYQAPRRFLDVGSPEELAITKKALT